MYTDKVYVYTLADLYKQTYVYLDLVKGFYTIKSVGNGHMFTIVSNKQTNVDALIFSDPTQFIPDFYKTNSTFMGKIKTLLDGYIELGQSLEMPAGIIYSERQLDEIGLIKLKLCDVIERLCIFTLLYEDKPVGYFVMQDAIETSDEYTCLLLQLDGDLEDPDTEIFSVGNWDTNVDESLILEARVARFTRCIAQNEIDF